MPSLATLVAVIPAMDVSDRQAMWDVVSSLACSLDDAERRGAIQTLLVSTVTSPSFVLDESSKDVLTRIMGLLDEPANVRQPGNHTVRNLRQLARVALARILRRSNIMGAQSQ